MRLKPAFPILDRSHWQADAMLGAWPFAEGAGNVIADASGQGNHGAFTGSPSWTAGQHGAALACDRSTNDGVIIPRSASLEPSMDFTIFARVRFTPEVAPSGYQFIAGKHFSPFSNPLYSYSLRWRDTGQWELDMNAGGTRSFLFTPFAYTKEWQTIVAQREGTALRLFSGSRLIGTGSCGSGSVAYSDTPLYMGYSPSASSFRLSGLLDTVQLFDWALSAGEIDRLNHDPYAAFRVNASQRLTLLLPRIDVDPPANLTAPTLTINSDGTWVGTVGTWTGEPTSYAWELRRVADDGVVASGTGEEPSGSGLSPGVSYYPWVEATNAAGSTSASGAAVVAQIAPDLPGVEYTIPTRRMHFTLPENRPRFRLPTRRCHYAIPAENHR